MPAIPPRCPRCGEDRVISRVDDKRGRRFVCDVCDEEWREEPITDVNGTVMDGQ